MGNLTRYVLWVYVFTLSWDNVPLPLIGSLSRAIGLAVISVAIATTIMRGRFRRPDPVLGFAIVFSGLSVLSLLWTISYEDTVARAYTYVQVVASAWLIREFVRTRKHIDALMIAFCVGSFVPLASLLRNFWVGVALPASSRFTASGLNANMVGILLAIGLPMAWHLLMHRRGMVRALAMIYFLTTPLALLLTASRGAFLAGIVAAAIVPVTLPRSVKSYASAALVLIVAIVSVVLVVPSANWERIGSISTEFTESGTMTGRTDIWKAGFQLYPERPVLGLGAGAYAVAVGPYLRWGRPMNSHNTAIGLLVEGGLVGLSLFAAVLAACAWAIWHFPPPHRALWAVVLSTWLVGAMDGNWEHVKITWVLFGLVSAQSGLESTVSKALPVEETRPASRLTTELLQPAHLSRTQRI